MARKFLTAINMSLNEIRSVLAEIIAGDPGSPVEGQFWYNSVLHRLKWRTDTASVTPVLYTDAPGGDIGGTYSNLQITAGAIVNADINAAAAIAYSKLNLAGSVVSADIVDGTIVNADINAAAAIALSKLATDPLARANHTGTQLAATISNFDTQVRTNSLSQMATPLANISMGGFLLGNVADPISAQDAATKAYVDAFSQGISWKDAVRAASTANTALTGVTVLDGITLNNGDRVLLKNQTAGAENGIYTWATGGALTRATDADSYGDLRSAAVFVEEGGTLANTGWLMTTDLFTLGTTSLTWVQFFGTGTFIAGAGLTLTGTTFAVGAGYGIVVGADDVAIDTTIVMRRFAVDCAAAASTTVTHNLNSRDVQVQVYDTATFETVEVDVVRTSVNVVTVTFAVAPAAAAYRIVVIG